MCNSSDIVSAVLPRAVNTVVFDMPPIGLCATKYEGVIQPLNTINDGKGKRLSVVYDNNRRKDVL